jgi:hypothetical protein
MGGGTTFSEGVIPPELRALFMGAANRVQDQQGNLPMTEFDDPDQYRRIVGPDPMEDYAYGQLPGLLVPSQYRAMALEQMMQSPALARQGPTTGAMVPGSSEDYGFMRQWQHPGAGLYSFDQLFPVGGGPPSPPNGPDGGGGGGQQPGGPLGSPRNPRQVPWRGDPGAPPTGGGPGGPGGGQEPPIAQAQGQAKAAQAPAQGGGGISKQALRNYILKDWEFDQKAAKNAGGPAQLTAKPTFRGFDEYGIARTQGAGQHEGQGLGFIDPRTGDYQTRTGARPDEDYMNRRMSELLGSQGRSMADLQEGRAQDFMPAAAPVMSAEEAARLNAEMSRNFRG